MMNQEPRAPISYPTIAGPACGDNDSARDYITVEDILGEMANGVADGEVAIMQEPKDIEVIEDLRGCLVASHNLPHFTLGKFDQLGKCLVHN